MLHEKAGKRGTRNRGRYQVAQSWLNRLYKHFVYLIKSCDTVLQKQGIFLGLHIDLKHWNIFGKHWNIFTLCDIAWYDAVKWYRNWGPSELFVSYFQSEVEC